jgi:hypothetical protein
VAYHLHRTHSRTTALTRAGITKDRAHASDLVQGRIVLTVQDIAFIAEKLGVGSLELTRALSEPETEEWAFYRTSARNRIVVWERARSFWHANKLSDSDAATALGLSRSTLSDVMMLRSRRVMHFAQAVRLGQTLDTPLLPSSLIDGLPDGFYIRG